MTDSWCYEEKLENCQEYGRLNTWEAAEKACEALGSGWRLPTDEEWKSLAVNFGCYSNYENSQLVDREDPKKAYSLLRATVRSKNVKAYWTKPLK